MDTGEFLMAGLTAVLVAITGYYAWQTYRMAQEMERARAVAVLPKLALKWHAVGPMHSFVRVASVGPGPALDVDVEIVFVPKAEPAAELRRRVQANLMAPGDSEDVMPIDPGGDFMDTAVLAERYDRIEMRGSISDVLEQSHVVTDSLAELEESFRLREEAQLRWAHPDPERRFAEEMSKQLSKPFGQVAKAVDQLRAELRAQREPRGEG